MYDFNEFAQAGQERYQRMMVEASGWRRMHDELIATQPQIAAVSWLRPILTSLMNLLAH